MEDLPFVFMRFILLIVFALFLPLILTFIKFLIDLFGGDNYDKYM